MKTDVFGILQVWSIQVCVKTQLQSTQGSIFSAISPQGQTEMLTDMAKKPRATSKTLQTSVSMFNVKDVTIQLEKD